VAARKKGNPGKRAPCNLPTLRTISEGPGFFRDWGRKKRPLRGSPGEYVGARCIVPLRLNNPIIHLSRGEEFEEGNKMECTILESVPFRIDLEELKKKMRVKEGSEMVEKLGAMAQEAQKIARPKVCYRIAYVESKADDHLVIEGIRFTSRVMRINLDKVFRVFPYVATCGLELEEWSKSFEDLLEQFWAEEIKVLAVRGTIRHLHEYLTDRYRPGQMSRMNPGSLPDWPLSEQKPLFDLLGSGPATIGVQLKDSFLMTPIKSVSGIWFPTEDKFENCRLCERQKCPGRRAPFEPGLMERKYQ